MVTKQEVEKTQKDMHIFLSQLYEDSNQDINKRIDRYLIGKKLGFNKEKTDKLIVRLKYCINGEGNSNFIRISIYGIEEIEKKYIPKNYLEKIPIQINNIKNSTGVIIGDKNKQEINITKNFEKIYNKIDSSNINNKSEVKLKVKNIEDELKKTNPSIIIIKKSIEFLSKYKWIITLIMNLINNWFIGGNNE